jgi:hypothetical protein
LAPLALSVAVAPAHIVAEFTEVEGRALTVTTVVLVLTQALEPVPVTVYTVVAEGLTVYAAVAGPPDQL